MDFETVKEIFEKANAVELEMYHKEYEYYNKNKRFTFNLTKEGKALIAQLKAARRNFYIAFDQYESDNDLIWKKDKWIDKFGYIDYFDSMEEARKCLLENVSKLPGVKVLSDASGIKTIQVNTKNKVYTYAIHARHGDGGYGCDLTFVDVAPRNWKLDEFREMLKEVK